MINILTEIIKKNPNWLTCPGSELSFMKVSTPASGKELNRGKVLIFVFEKNEIFPTLCVKTARTYSGGEIIKLNFSHLQLLTDSLVNTAHKDLFAKPLHIYDDNKIIFSIESACQGEMFSSQNKSIASVFEKYTQWQESLTNSTARTLRIQDLNKIATDFIDALLCSEETKTELSNYYKSFALDPETELPELLQHGDMTPDNVLVNGENIHIVDYDYVGLSRIPGFDLFHFFSKARKMVVHFVNFVLNIYQTIFHALVAR